MEQRGKALPGGEGAEVREKRRKGGWASQNNTAHSPLSPGPLTPPPSWPESPKPVAGRSSCKRRGNGGP